MALHSFEFYDVTRNSNFELFLIKIFLFFFKFLLNLFIQILNY